MVTRTMRDEGDDIGGAGSPGEGTVRFLKWLVTVLTLTMILGVLTIVALFVMRFADATSVDVPSDVVLPEGARATAFTPGEGWFAVVTDQGEILIYDRVTGVLRQRIEVEAD